MSDYITTYTGNHIDPANPDPEKISIRDIAHALSLICRGNGHVRSFWSVGQHCLDCAREAEARKLSDRMILACLLHDASECYMSDVPRPMKKHMPEYQQQEKKALKVIFEKFLGSDLTEAEWQQLKEIDDALLWHDLETLLAEMQHGPMPDLHIKIDFSFRPFKDVEQEYLEMFYRYTGGYARK